MFKKIISILQSIQKSKINNRKSAFTLVELMITITIMAIVTTVTFMTFSTITTAWKRGIELSEGLHHGDFVLEQVVAGLASSYFPDVKGGNGKYGFTLEDEGSDEYSADIITWTKLGPAMVGEDYAFLEVPHRVRLTIEDNEDGESAIAVRVWRVYGEKKEFDLETDTTPIFLSPRIKGFNCQVRDPDPISEDENEIEWTDEWEETNRIPTHVSITLYMDSTDDDEDTVELKRIVTIPVAPLSWR